MINNGIIMAHFIGVTDFNDEKLLINIDNILWFKTYDKEHAIIYLAATGKNEYPVSLYVKESQDTIMKWINNAYK